MTEEKIDYETGEQILTSQREALTAQAALFAKLARVMGRLKKLPKSGYNEHFKYNFVTESDVSDAVRAALAAENVAFLARMRATHPDGKKTIVEMEYTFADGETGAIWASIWTGEAIDSQDKGIAQAATSALKYFLMKTFVLSSGDPGDDSDNGAESKPTNGGKISRLIARINDLNGQLAEPDEIDETWFDEATEAELTAYGKLLRKRVDEEAK